VLESLRPLRKNQYYIHNHHNNKRTCSHTPQKTSQAKMVKGATVNGVRPYDLIRTYARFLKKSGKVVLPKWVDHVRTSIAREMPPEDPDWFYIRCAAVARKFYRHNGLGVQGLRKIYGDTKRRGARPDRAVLASGAVLRAAIKQLELLKVLEKDPKGGRRLSSTGRRDLDRIAAQLPAYRA